ncbi:release factor glutamine methyltransferase [Spiroplasma chinense]|uniref:peptide chain release factor N(5)-glutamine methyltransferase n=1 Tax=Spiroplasma chinense TaxID=216932 RepID=A0A5B9Y5Q5_9MOLU|nr:peptide chain release factor N(5)-glutamine methyltransferase [Spiroplasma chinense]QEH62371.1 release factor glutamine methyltransferase [Spiroplasma chinense]
MKSRDLFDKFKTIIDVNTFNEIIYHIKKTSTNLFPLEINLTDEEVDCFFNIVNKLEQGLPLAYVINSKYFFENTFYVNENVLIPRLETELIVEEVLNLDLKNKTLFDICTGSGCIGISLKLKESTLNLILSDISNESLEVCKRNLKSFGLEAQIFQADYLEVFDKSNQKPDIITINPPYIDKEDENVDMQTLKNEPHLALFAENKGLYFYETLFSKLEYLFNLNDDLKIVCEFGFEQKDILERQFKNLGVKYKIDFKKDYFNNWRYFVISN